LVSSSDEYAVNDSQCSFLLVDFMVQEGVMLNRVLPWLWRLADDEGAACSNWRVPPQMKQQLLEALLSCPAAEYQQVITDPP
jgi:hypothetical protein